LSSGRGWIGVDLDGTLAVYHGWDGGKIGPPVEPMLERVRAWRGAGIEVRIVTARVADGDGNDSDVARAAVEAWLLEHVGEVLPVTCTKDFRMVELWDDRAVRVVSNTGRRCCGGEEEAS
jgi:hypothetical protein